MKLIPIDGTEFSIQPTVTLSYTHGPSKTIPVGSTIRGTRGKDGNRPIAIRWNNCDNVKPTPELMSWVISELGNALHPKAYRYIKSHALIAEDMRNSK